jgi:hypothetical protein
MKTSNQVFIANIITNDTHKFSFWKPTWNLLRFSQKIRKSWESLNIGSTDNDNLILPKLLVNNFKSCRVLLFS